MILKRPDNPAGESIESELCVVCVVRACGGINLTSHWCINIHFNVPFVRRGFFAIHLWGERSGERIAQFSLSPVAHRRRGERATTYRYMLTAESAYAELRVPAPVAHAHLACIVCCV